MERKVHTIEIFILFGFSMLGTSVIMHEIGHAVACIAQGFELLEINLLSSYVRCSVSNPLVWIMGGGIGSMSMLSFLYVKRIRRFLPVSLGFFTVALTQFLNMILEGFWNTMYSTLDLENYVLVFGCVMIVAFWLCCRSKLKGQYSIKIDKTGRYSIKKD